MFTKRPQLRLSEERCKAELDRYTILYNKNVERYNNTNNSEFYFYAQMYLKEVERLTKQLQKIENTNFSTNSNIQ